MRFLSTDEVLDLSSWVWKTWRPSLYHGEVWWKFEDIMDISVVLDNPLGRHKICNKLIAITQYVPFGKLLLKQKPSPKKDIKKNISTIRCVLLAPCRSSNAFVSVDTEGNVMVFYLDDNKFWIVMKCTDLKAISFCHLSQNELLLGRESGRIDKISIEPQWYHGHFSQHSFPVQDMLFFSEEICLSYSKYEMWIWNCVTFEALHSLTFQSDRPAYVVAIVPNEKNQVLTILSDTTLHLWKRERNTTEAPRLISSYLGNEFMMEDGITCIDFTKDGSLMAAAGNHKLISLIDTTKTSWVLNKVFQLPQTANAVNEMKFLNIPNHFMNLKGEVTSFCLVVLTLPFNEFIIYDLNNSYYEKSTLRPKCFLLDVEGDPLKFHLIPFQNTYAIFQLQSGFIDIYTTFWWLNNNFCSWLHYERILGTTEVKKKPALWDINNEKPIHLPRGSQGPGGLDERGLYQYILHQIGQLPPAERKNYWKLGLAVPGNMVALNNVLLSELHPCCQMIQEDFPGLPKENLFILSRVLSAFYYHSSLFFLMNEFPRILLHFLKALTWSPLSTFEILLTIVNNFCTDWYEDIPNPSKSILTTIKCLINKYDPSLASHFNSSRIPLNSIAWNMLSTFFINVLDYERWSILWDHIIFSDKYFMIMVSVSIIMCSRCIFFKYSNETDHLIFNSAIKTSDLNVGSVILIAYDLHSNETSSKNCDIRVSFIPLNSRKKYRPLNLNYNKNETLRNLRKKLHLGQIKEIKFQENLDVFKLLDPRATQPAARLIFMNADALEKNKEYESIERRDEPDSDRLNKFRHLQRLVANRPLHWINGFRARVEERKRLVLFQEVCPLEEDSLKKILSIEFTISKSVSSPKRKVQTVRSSEVLNTQTMSKLKSDVKRSVSAIRNQKGHKLSEKKRVEQPPIEEPVEEDLASAEGRRTELQVYLFDDQSKPS